MTRLALTLGLLAVSTLACASAGGVEAQRRPYPDARGYGRPPMVSVWLGSRSIFSRGNNASVSFRTDRDAYVTVIRIDTDGRLTVLYPEHPVTQRRLQAGRTYSVRSGAFRVHDRMGLGYVFAIASHDPFDYSAISRGRRWDYMRVRHVRYDPFEAMYDLAEMIMWDRHSQYSLDYDEYYVERRVAYPRYMCLDAVRGDPYLYSCNRYAVVYRASPHRYGYGPYYGYGARGVYVRQPVRYAHIEQKQPVSTPPRGTAPVDAVDRRRRDDDDDRRRSPVTEPRRVETRSGQDDARGAPRRVDSEPSRTPAVDSRDATDPRATPRRAPEVRDATPAPAAREESRDRRSTPAPAQPAPRAAPERQAAPERRAPERRSDGGRDAGASDRDSRGGSEGNADRRRRTPDS